MADALVLRGVTKTFGDTVAVRDLDLTVPEGGLYGVIGPNGAGKTTTIRMILSILLPDRGELSILGRPSAAEAKDYIGYLPEERGLYRKMRVGEFLLYMARLKGVRGSQAQQSVQAWLERVELGEVAPKRCEELSKGMQQKVQFVAAVIHQPELLILDEPFAGLDPVNQHLMRDLVLDEHRRGATVLFSTHIMGQAEQLCDHVVMIHEGRKVLDATMAGIRAQFDPRSLLFEPLDPAAPVATAASVPGVRAIHREGALWEIALSDDASPAQVIGDLAIRITPARIEVRRPTLEDVFIQIVTDGRTKAGEDLDRLLAGLRDPGATTGAR
ncbi:MAG: ATP-binding cassette domain-containing protein [Candidatus Latescibacterota bacterium]|jgi:ABC-2 type transport system ATP-binding protein